MITLRPLTLAVIATLPLLAALPSAQAAQAAQANDGRRAYIVQLADKPVAAYSGDISGLRATRAAAGQRIDLSSSASQQYRSYLATQQTAAKALIASGAVTRDYKVVFNGFAARLTDAEVRTLKASGKVLRITADEPLHVVTNYTPTFLGLNQPGGLWDQLGGKQQAGEDVIVGVIDTGIWPENLSFADRVDADGKPTFDASGTLAYGAPPARWHGVCQTGEGFSAANCNNKLIGARYFDEGFRASGNYLHEASEFRSPRDSLSAPVGDGGHGTHTSSTAAGNAGVPALTNAGLSLGVRDGIAPRARVAMYKICWTFAKAFDPGNGVVNSCFNSDSLAAIEAAVSDGVDVINYSISGGASALDPVEQAFRNAVEAGVFVAAAAGNSGPDNAVAHISPWLTTVAAASHDRANTATVTLGNGQQYSGPSLASAALPATILIRGEDAALPGVSAFTAAHCYASGDDPNQIQPLPSLDPAKVAGKIVSCLRGNNDRTHKADAVKAAGGVGMLLLDDGNGVMADLYAVPTIHVDQASGVLIDAYAAAGNASAALSASALSPVPGPIVADFSSRGPNQFDPGVLKPDLTAPGVNIVAGISPSVDLATHAAIVAGTDQPRSESGLMSGTSMATPHVAGLAALLHQRHPTWSPAAVKSALMTTTRGVLPNTLVGDQDGTLPWGQGAGHVVPNSAADPGLVYDAGAVDYKKYMCGISGAAEDCTVGSLSGYGLNLASITLPDVVGIQTVTRSVTNVSDHAAIYTGSATIDGYTATLTPASLMLEPGQTQSYQLRLQRTSAADQVWQFGEVIWNDSEHTVRSPLQARYNSGAVAPALISADRVSGTRLIGIATGYDGTIGVAKAGMREYTQLAQSVTQAPANSLESLENVVAACSARGAGVKAVTLGVPNHTMIARFELSNLDTDGGADDDLDLALLDQGNGLIAYSAHDGSNESITLITPPMGVVKVCVLGYKLKNGASTNYKLSYATTIPNDTKGALKFGVPGKVKLGGTATVAMSWSGLEQGKRYLGGMQLLNAEGRVVSLSEINIDTRDVTPISNSAKSKRVSR